MSFRVNIELVCDGCGKGYGAATHSKSGTEETMGHLVVQAKVWDKWMIVERGRHYAPTHWCPTCADLSGAKKVPRPKEKTWLVPPMANTQAEERP
jgi:hypothetical protein